MEALGYPLLAGAGLAENEDARAGRSEALDGLAERANPGRFSNETKRS